MHPTVVAYYYDPGRINKYAVDATKLKKRCNALGLPYHIRKVDLSEYITKFKRRNNRKIRPRYIIYRYTPTFLLDALSVVKGPVLYLHADADIVSKPPASAYPKAMEIGYSVAPDDAVKERVWAMPLFFDAGRGATAFLKIWKAKCDLLNTDQAEHVLLHRTLDDFKCYPGVMRFPVNMADRYKPRGNACKDAHILF